MLDYFPLSSNPRSTAVPFKLQVQIYTCFFFFVLVIQRLDSLLKSLLFFCLLSASLPRVAPLVHGRAPLGSVAPQVYNLPSLCLSMVANLADSTVALSIVLHLQYVRLGSVVYSVPPTPTCSSHARVALARYRWGC